MVTLRSQYAPHLESSTEYTASLPRFEGEAKQQGPLRTEGKQCVVQDGDVLHILFNV